MRFMYDHWFARTEERVQGRRFSSFAFYWVLGWRLGLYVPAFITVADYELNHSANTEVGMLVSAWGVLYFVLVLQIRP